MSRCIFLIAVLLAASVAAGQAYPTKPVRVIVPFAPGGGSDILARQLVPKLTEYLGQPFVVDNRGGAGGLVGSEIAAQRSIRRCTTRTSSGASAPAGCASPAARRSASPSASARTSSAGTGSSPRPA